ncbi:septal ring lytic transglycosylase RlpA family protein [Erythrobacter sp. GH1-10]|uniref:septal ring lytic transglycosylase RlpA family protein n=1 Tax=Erythrobacter sp. GH1-10 TaxID=3349334 RepID=UPI003877D263
MPSRRARLREFMQLKSQRRSLVFLSGALGVLCLIFGSVLWSERASPDFIKLGVGKASVEAQPIAMFESVSVQSEAVAPKPSPSASDMGVGEASYYGPGFEGNLTANGEIFDPGQLTAAHRTLPMGSRVLVTNPRNDESVVVRINDRGPYHGNRVIDLSVAAAREIGLIQSGTGQVQLALIVA